MATADTFAIGDASAAARRVLRCLGTVVGLLLLAGLYARYLQSLPSSDWNFYYEMLGLAQRGIHPFVDYWTEYPPLFPLLLVAVQHTLGPLLWTDQDSFSSVYIGFMTGVYIANLVLVWDLVRRAHGARAARFVVVLYTTCPLIAWFTVGWFDGLAVLLLLLGLRALLARGATRAGVLIGLGILMKVFPGVLLLAAPAILGRRGTIRLVAAVTTVLAGVLVPLAIIRFDLLWATAMSIMTRPAWETLPAVLAGDYLYGLVAPIAERFTAEAARSAPGPTSSLAFALQLVTAGIALAATAYRTRHGKFRAADLYALAALAICALLLGSKGFSPQYFVWLLPLVLLVWPNRVGLVYILAFSLYGYLYYQFWLHDIIGYFQMDAVPLEQVARSAWLSAGTRTALLIIVGAHLLIRMCCQGQRIAYTAASPLLKTLSSIAVCRNSAADGNWRGS